MACYRLCLAQTFLALEKYPHLQLLHLDLNYSTYRWNIGRVGALLDGRQRGWVSESMLISAWQTAGLALDVSFLARRLHGRLSRMIAGGSHSKKHCTYGNNRGGSRTPYYG